MNILNKIFGPNPEMDKFFDKMRGRNRKKLYKLLSKGETKYKYFSRYGWRGTPKTTRPLGTQPAPTLDQVRRVEKRYGVRLIVKNGILFFKDSGQLFSKEAAQARKESIV